MSRVYQALEKAEREKKERTETRAPAEVLPERVILKEEVRLEPAKERKRALELPVKEKTPVLMVSPNSIAAEEFRKLKTQIFQRLPNPPRSILITSTTPGEGKTMVSVNLAMAISKEFQKKAILIDADLRKPSIHLKNYPNSKGLSNYLSDQTPLSDILLKYEDENLWIIPAGPPSGKSPELVGSKKMEEFLASLRESGGNAYMIIDSTPIISTVEPAILAKMVDGVILVVRGGRTPKESVQRAIKSIDRQKIIGLVFNHVDMQPSRYFSEYYRYYRYYDGEK